MTFPEKLKAEPVNQMKVIYTLEKVSLNSGTRTQVDAPFSSRRKAIQAAKKHAIARHYVEVLACEVGVTPHQFCVYQTPTE